MKPVSPRASAFLAEMGIGPLWTLRQPAPGPAAVDIGVALADQASAALEQEGAGAAVAPVEQQGAAAAAVPDIAQMDWPALRVAIASCERCGACRAGARPVYGAGAERAVWLVAAGATSGADEAAGLPVAGEAGTLLDNMLAAAGHARARDVYVTNLVKCRPVSANGGDRAPSAEEVAACRPFVERELALSGATVMLTLGQAWQSAADGARWRARPGPCAGRRRTGRHAASGRTAAARRRQGAGLGRPVSRHGSECARWR